MRPSVAIKREDKSVIRRPSETDTSRILQNRIDGCGATGEDCRERQRLNICDNESPRKVDLCQRGPRRAAGSRLAEKRDLLSIRRPCRQGIARGRWGDKSDGLVRSEQSDKTVIGSIRNKRERASVRRPDRRFGRTPREEQQLRGLRSINGCRPDPLVFRECNAATVGSNDEIVAVGEDLCLSTGHRHRPYLDLRLNRKLGRVRRTVITRPPGAVVPATDIDDCLAIVGECEMRQLLSIVILIRRDSPSLEDRSRSNVNVSDTALIETPGDGRSYR